MRQWLNASAPYERRRARVLRSVVQPVHVDTVHVQERLGFLGQDRVVCGVRMQVLLERARMQRCYAAVLYLRRIALALHIVRQAARTDWLHIQA